MRSMAVIVLSFLGNCKLDLTSQSISAANFLFYTISRNFDRIYFSQFEIANKISRRYKNLTAQRYLYST